MKSFLKLIILTLFFFINGYTFGQNLSVSYEFSLSNDTIHKKQNYVLDILNQKSIFRTVLRKSSDSMISKTGLGLGYNADPFYELYFVKDLNNSVFKKPIVLPINRDKFFVKIYDKLDWKILQETTTISNYNCQKAEVKYGDRIWTAWFTKDISIQEGPYYFYGLPGLILRIEDSNKNFIFYATEIKKLAENSFYELDNGIEIDWKQYEKLFKEFYENPYSSIKTKGMKVVKDNGSGGYQEINYRERTREIQKMLIRNNNPIELNHKIDFK